MNVHVLIEELVLEGFDPTQRARIGAAVQDELKRLLANQGPMRHALKNLVIPSLEGGSVSLAPGLRPEDAGVRIARALYAGLDRVRGDRPVRPGGPAGTTSSVDDERR